MKKKNKKELKQKEARLPKEVYVVFKRGLNILSIVNIYSDINECQKFVENSGRYSYFYVAVKLDDNKQPEQLMVLAN